MKLTRQKQDKLWGETGPYSEAWLVIETRILDDSVSRIFISVEVHINPFTFELIEKNREQFADDHMIQQLLDNSEFRGQSYGYVTSAFLDEYTDEKVMKEAKKHLEFAKNTIIKMHRVVLDLLESNTKKNN